MEQLPREYDGYHIIALRDYFNDKCKSQIIAGYTNTNSKYLQNST